MYRESGTVVCFCGARSTLSNLAPYQLTIRLHEATDTTPPRDVHFNSSEHAYQWTKLHFLGLHQEADWIFRHESPMAAMQGAKAEIGVHVRGLRRKDPQAASALEDRIQLWRNHRAEDVLEDLAIRKAKAYPHFAALLLRNNGKRFVEATPDKHWGCGFPTHKVQTMSDRELLATMPGQNRMGQILTAVASTWHDYTEVNGPFEGTLRAHVKFSSLIQ